MKTFIAIVLFLFVTQIHSADLWVNGQNITTPTTYTSDGTIYVGNTQVANSTGQVIFESSNAIVFSAPFTAINGSRMTARIIDTTLPTITITSPTSSDNYTVSFPSISIGGNASDNVGITEVSWVNYRGGSGYATGTSVWTANNIGLQPGINAIVVTASDAAGNTAADLIFVNYQIPGDLYIYSSATVPQQVNLFNASTGTFTATLNLTYPAGAIIPVSAALFDAENGSMFVMDPSTFPQQKVYKFRATDGVSTGVTNLTYPSGALIPLGPKFGVTENEVFVWDSGRLLNKVFVFNLTTGNFLREFSLAFPQQATTPLAPLFSVCQGKAYVYDPSSFPQRAWAFSKNDGSLISSFNLQYLPSAGIIPLNPCFTSATPNLFVVTKDHLPRKAHRFSDTTGISDLSFNFQYPQGVFFDLCPQLGHSFTRTPQ